MGVIVARFQTPELTQAHRDLIDTVKARHPKFAILLGIARVIPTTKNPLDYSTRQKMILAEYPGIEVLPLHDCRSDVEWSASLDKILRQNHPHEKIVLYGGRDSFAKCYTGRFAVCELEETESTSGTIVREAAFHDVRDTADFRAGICYGVANQYPRINPTVDVAVERGEEVLLARKAEDGNKWRFIGGHIDPRETAEMSARREVMEESGAEVFKMKYITSTAIDDWRYRGTNQSIFTTFFVAPYIGGPVAGSDDVTEVKWFNTKSLNENQMVPEHHVLLDAYLRFKGLRGQVSIDNGNIGLDRVEFIHQNGKKMVTSPVDAALVLPKE